MEKALAVTLSAALLAGMPSMSVLAEEADAVVSEETAAMETVRETAKAAASYDRETYAANSFTNLQCGENVYATLESGTLTISGTGTMWKVVKNNSVYSAFMGYESVVREVVVKAGVTSIAARAFYDFSQLEKVTLPDSIEVIGAEAFEDTNIRRLVCPKNLTEIGYSAFYGTALQSVSFNEGLNPLVLQRFSLRIFRR